jgi:hypothetical protein
MERVITLSLRRSTSFQNPASVGVPAKTAEPVSATTSHRATPKDRFAGFPGDFAPLPYAPPRPFPPERMRFTSASLSTTTPKNGDIISSQLISP